jgi:ribosomal protein S2
MARRYAHQLQYRKKEHLPNGRDRKDEKDGTFSELTKKEGLMLDREREKLEQTLGGIANMTVCRALFLLSTPLRSISPSMKLLS